MCQFISPFSCYQSKSKGLASDINIYVGSTLGDKEGQKYKVSEVIIHPNRVEETKEYDQALLLLEKSLQLSERVKPICLPSGSNATPSSGTMVMASGWGSDHPTETRQGGDSDLVGEKI